MSATATVRAETDLDESVCNVVLEPFAFWMWQRAAGTPYLRDDRVPVGVEVMHHRTQDGRLLHGYRLKAKAEAGAAPKGFLLVAQGNATLAERLIGRLHDIADIGYDVYLYDYRGYARSEGKRRLKAIASDYEELFAELSRDSSRGTVAVRHVVRRDRAVKVMASGAGYDRAVIDSTPSTVSNYGCPQQYDPVRNLPADAARLR